MIRLPLRGAYLVGGLVAYGLAALIYFYAQGIALDTYNSVCAPGDRFFMIDPPEIIGKTLLVTLVPVLASRSLAIARINFYLSLIAVAFALVLIGTAHQKPQECVTMGGDYEDHASGLFEYVLFLILLQVLAYAMTAGDWLFWTGRNIAIMFLKKSR